jgi:RHS repeat-associated protein
VSHSGAVISTYYYLRDAQGNEMCRYVKYTNTTSQLMYVAQEHSIYGSSRVGVDNRKDTLYMGAVYTPTWGGVGTSRRDLGSKSFELANHLGNVLVTVSDKPIYKVSSATIFFQPEITSSSDYYPFGAPIQGRSAAFGGEYRFGFNGKENDRETETQDYGMRINDCRLGRFLSVDPLTKDYPYLTPYAFAENDVIRCIDLDGLEKVALSGNVPPEQYYKIKDGVRVPGTTHYTPLHIAQFKKQTEFLKNKYGYNTTMQVSTGQELLKALINETTNAGEITHLSIFAHGGVGRLANGGTVGGLFFKSDAGFYSKTVEGTETGSVQQLSELINNGDIKFAKNASIFLDACNTAGLEGDISIDNFAEQLCLTTGANVYACSGHMAQETQGTANGMFKIPEGEDGNFYKYSRIEENYDDNGTKKTRFVVKKENIGRHVDVKQSN